MIKTIYDKNKLIEYNSNEELSMYELEDIIEDNKFIEERNPFKIKIPINQVEKFKEIELPKIEKKYKIVYLKNKELKFSKKNIDFDIETKLENDINLLEFKLKFKINDEIISFEKIKQILSEERNSYELKNGERVTIENLRDIKKWIEFLKKFEFKRSENKFKADSKSVLELDEFLKNIKNKTLITNEEYKILITELRTKKPIEKIEIPHIKNTVLRDYQKEGIYWLHFFKKI